MIYRMEQFYDENSKRARTYEMNNKTKNIIFLDIDGVLQPTMNERRFSHDLDQTVAYLCEKYHDDIYHTFDCYDVGAVYYDWDYGAIGLLRGLIEETHSVIVIHSSWGHRKDVKQLKALFRLYDLDQFIMDVVRSPIYCKEDAINEYLEQHQVIDHYIVIDDDVSLLMAFGEHCCHTKKLLTTNDCLYCQSMLRNTYRIEQNTNDHISKISLYYSNYESNALAEVKLKLLEVKGEKPELICLFNMRLSSDIKLENIILLNRMIKFCNEKKSRIMIAYTDDIKDLQFRLAHEYKMYVPNKEKETYHGVDITIIYVWYTSYSFLDQNEALIVKELDSLR